MTRESKIFYAVTIPFGSICMGIGMFVFGLEGDALMATWLAPMFIVMFVMLRREEADDARSDRRGQPPPHRGA